MPLVNTPIVTLSQDELDQARRIIALETAGATSTARTDTTGTAYTVANIPTAVGRTGQTAYVSNGAAGQPCLAFSNGTAWKRAELPATTISAT